MVVAERGSACCWLCVARYMVGGVREPGRMPGGWVLSKIAVAGALEGWPGGCMAVTWLRPGWLTG